MVNGKIFPNGLIDERTNKTNERTSKTMNRNFGEQELVGKGTVVKGTLLIPFD